MLLIACCSCHQCATRCFGLKIAVQLRRVDVFKALALGARGVLIGRPWVWALAAEGEAGVGRLLAHWRQELKVTMMLTGVTRVQDIHAAHLDGNF